MKQLIVYLLSDRVGTLEQDDSGLLAFRYDPQWLDAPGAMPLSRSIAITAIGAVITALHYFDRSRKRAAPDRYRGTGR